MNTKVSFSNEEVKKIYLLFEGSDGDLDQDFFDKCSIVKPVQIEAIVEKVLVVPNISRDKEMIAESFDAAEIEALISFGGYAKTLEIIYDLVDSSRCEGHAKIRSPISKDQISSDVSVFCGGVNFLRFKVKGEVIYLIQHDLVAEAIFFPARDIAVGFGDFQSPYGKIKRLITELFKFSKQYSDYFSGIRSWGGVYAGSKSPYHYFYFDVPVLFHLEQRNPSGIPRVYAMEEEMYINPVGALSLNSELLLVKYAQDIKDDLHNKRRFVFLIGAKMEAWINVLEVDSLNCGIIDYALKVTQLPIVDKQGSGVISIWLGVSGGKRVWIEEVEALKKLIEELSTYYVGVEVIVDGWTDVECTSATPTLYSGDEDRAKDLISGLPPTVMVKNLVGASACYKIGYALMADFFVSSHGTASLFVSRICSVPGVTHISNTARPSALKSHVHPCATIVPESIVTDLKTGNEATGYHVSYSMMVPEFLKFVQMTMKN